MHSNLKTLRYRGVTYYRTNHNQVPYEEYKRQSLELSWLKERVTNLDVLESLPFQALYEEYIQHLCNVREDTDS